MPFLLFCRFLARRDVVLQQLRIFAADCETLKNKQKWNEPVGVCNIVQWLTHSPMMGQRKNMIVSVRMLFFAKSSIVEQVAVGFVTSLIVNVNAVYTISK